VLSAWGSRRHAAVDRDTQLIIAVYAPAVVCGQEDGVCEEPGLLRQLELMRTAKLMRLALICQDMADGLMAANDITGGGQLTLL
jgi:hypothetical protein